jgi:putative hydrolase of the HAD superfamily
MNLPPAIFLDLDDTIVADSEAADACWMTVCLKRASELPEITPQALYDALLVRRDWFWSDPERHRTGRCDMKAARREIVMRTFEDQHIDDRKIALALADDYTAERHRVVYPFPRSIETLEKLRQTGIRLALLTNGDARYQRDKIARFDLEKYFECIVVESEFGVGKPDAAVFRHAVERLNVQAREVWMVGDNLAFDVLPALTLGMRGIWVDHRSRGLPEDACCTPSRTIRSIRELV